MHVRYLEEFVEHRAQPCYLLLLLTMGLARPQIVCRMLGESHTHAELFCCHLSEQEAPTAPLTPF